MKEHQSKNRATIIAAIITGGCAVIAVLISPFVEQFAKKIFEVTPTGSEIGPSLIETVDQESSSTTSFCDGIDWESCWQIDDSARTVSWIGFSNGASDIGLGGMAFQKVRAGYEVIVILETTMTINICSGTIDGVVPSGDCPKTFTLSPGEHHIFSPGESGGFTIYP